MFYKVQDSFVENYEKIVERELTPQKNISFEFGPYYLEEKEGRWKIDNLIEKVEKLNGKEENAIKSHLRQWMSEMHLNTEAAKQMLERMKYIASDSGYKYIKEVTNGNERGEDKLCYPVYDILALRTIESQETK